VSIFGSRGQKSEVSGRQKEGASRMSDGYLYGETVTQIAQTDGQDIYDTAPAFGVIVMVMVMAPAHGTPPKLRQTNGKLMADTLGETFACLTWHTMATPIANPNENPNPNPNSNLYSIESHGLHSKKKNQKTGQVNKRGTENCSRCTCITYI